MQKQIYLCFLPIILFFDCLAFVPPLSYLPSYLKSSISKLLYQRSAKTTLIYLPINERTKKPTPQHTSALIALPREIREQIATYLSLNDILSLKLSCRHLYHTGLALGILFYQMRKNPDLRFERLCMAERDQENKSRKRARSIICSSCRLTHSRKMFSQNEMEKRAELRRCLGQEGRLCNSPDYGISFFDLASMLSKIKLFQSYTQHAIPLASIYNRQLGRQAQGPNGLPFFTSDLCLQRRPKDHFNLSYK